ncbi:MAG: hypothetical protein IPK33_03115 [Gemmatimonadetes bacterium]|nr:hypothetical protein [Gemmatimonadota bacterium]
MATSTYKRVKCKIGSVEFYPIEVKYGMSRSANQVGRRIGESLQARAFVWVDPHDVARLSQDSLVNLWKIATEPKDPLYKVEVTWYLEDGDKVLSAAEFMGWISVFQFTNPALSGLPGTGGDLSGKSSVVQSQTAYNNLLYLELVVTLDEPNISKHRFTK